MILFDIAFQGMNGRKRDTLLVFIVVILSFAFIVSATMFYAGISGTEEKNRLNLYGKWQAAYMSGDQDMVDYFKSYVDIDTISVCGIVDQSTDAGIIGTFDGTFEQIGNIQMATGIMPIKENEIAIEVSKAGEMNLTEDDVGTDIAINSEIVEYMAEQEDINDYYTRMHEKYDNTGIETTYYWVSNLTPIVTEEDKVISYITNYLYYGPVVNNQEEIINGGGLVESKTFKIYRNYVLTGLINTYTDRWNTGEYPMANSFITTEGQMEYMEDFKYCGLQSNKDGEGYENEIIYNIFMHSSTMGADLYPEIYEDVSKYIIEKNTNENNKKINGLDITVDGFKNNSMAYPEQLYKQKEKLIYDVMCSIFAVSFIAILQLYLTQVRRRARTFALLKSIGATNDQIANIFVYEGLMTLAVCMPVGIGLGIGISTLAAKISTLLNGVIMIAYNPRLMAIGIGACCIALVIGMIIPVIYAIKVPLTGEIEKPIRHAKSNKDNRICERLAKRPSVKRTLRMINSTHARLNKGKSAFMLALSIAACFMFVLSTLLGYLCHEDYIDKVIAKGKPGYVAEMLYGCSDNSIDNISKAINKVKGVKTTEIIWKGNDLHLYYDGIDKDEMLNAFKESIPSSYQQKYFAGINKQYGIKEVDNALITNMYAVNIKGEDNGYYIAKATKEKYTPYHEKKGYEMEWKSIFKCDYGSASGKIMDSIDMSTFDSYSFWMGDSVILLMPMYSKADEERDAIDINLTMAKASFQSAIPDVLQATGKYKFSYNNADKGNMEINQNIKVGDKIWICADQEIAHGETIIHKYDPIEVKVGAIVSYFGDKSLWPFQQTNQGYAVVGSEFLMEQVYNGFNSGGVQNLGKEKLQLMNKTIAKVKLGRTLFYIYGDNSMNYEQTDSVLSSLGNQYGFVLTNHRVSNHTMLAEARNNTTIVALLCITSGVLAMVILYNILSSLVEQDTKRIGILQAIGITAKQLKSVNLKTGIRNGLISIGISYTLLALILYTLVTVYAPSKGISSGIYLQRLESYYPIWILISITVVYLLATVVVYCIPFNKTIKRSPVENINK